MKDGWSEHVVDPVGVQHEGGVGDVMLPCSLSKSQTIFMCTSIRGCDVAQMVMRRLAVRQARVRFPARARHPREVFPTELTSDEERWRGTSAGGDG